MSPEFYRIATFIAWNIVGRFVLDAAIFGMAWWGYYVYWVAPEYTLSAKETRSKHRERRIVLKMIEEAIHRQEGVRQGGEECKLWFLEKIKSLSVRKISGIEGWRDGEENDVENYVDESMV